MEKQTVLITGASSGFGLLTAIELAKRDFIVFATMRNFKKSEKIKQLCEVHDVRERVKCIELDVASQQSIDRLTTKLKDMPPIDVLINNAGFAFGGFCEETSIAEYKEQFETNFFGAIAVTQAVLPSMRKRKKGKIINLSSISGQMSFPGLSPYVASKHALEGWSECLRLEVQPFGIDVALIEPGSFKTSIWSAGKKIAVKSQLNNSPYSSYMNVLERELEKGKSNHENPWIVASLIAGLCTRKEIPRLRYPVGKGVRIALFVRNILPWKVWEKIILNRLRE